MAGPSTRSAGPMYNPEVHFSPNEKFQPPEKLPTVKSVLCSILYHVRFTLKGQEGGIGGGGVSVKEAIREVAKQVYSKWFCDTVCCLSISTIERKLMELFSVFKEGRKRIQEKGKEDSPAVKKYRKLVDEKEKLFDVFQTDPKGRARIQAEWGVNMSDCEYKYYEDQKGERKMFCSKGVDPVWYEATMRAQRLRERQAEYRASRDLQFAYKSITEITKSLRDAGEIVSSSEKSIEKEETLPEEISEMAAKETKDRSKNKRRFEDAVEPEDDDTPVEYRHIRKSQRLLKD